MTTLPPIRREVLVEADPAFAFEVFTDRIGTWWALAELSVYGPDATVCFEDGKIVERSPSGEQSEWGSVTDWQPAKALGFTWHPGSDESKSSAVAVTFHERGDRTLVVLEHGGWDVFADPEAARAEYEEGWPAVLGHFAEHAAGATEWTWAALMHSPGPTAPTGGSVFEDPRFPEHIAFLQRMNEKGYLVAAGPLGTAGRGMTVLRIPGADRHDDVDRLANQDDQAVQDGLLQVEVHPWNVMFHSVDHAPHR